MNKFLLSTVLVFGGSLAQAAQSELSREISIGEHVQKIKEQGKRHLENAEYLGRFTFPMAATYLSLCAATMVLRRVPMLPKGYLQFMTRAEHTVGVASFLTTVGFSRSANKAREHARMVKNLETVEAASFA